jgi:hypothetical protein
MGGDQWYKKIGTPEMEYGAFVSFSDRACVQPPYKRSAIKITSIQLEA